MSNLYKYIQIINEEEDNKGIEYEKTIFRCFQFIEHKDEILNKLNKLKNSQISNSQNENTSSEDLSDEDKKKLENLEKLKIELENLEKLKIELEELKIEKESNIPPRKKIKERSKEIKKKFEKIKQDIITIDQSYKKLFIKENSGKPIITHRIETVINNINNFINSGYNKKNSVIDYDIEFAKCEDASSFGQPILKYKNIYNGCKKFLDKMGINKISGVRKPKQAQISDYWKQLLKNDQNQKDAVNVKTDICFMGDSKLYKLSIKYDDVQLASPKYADIYILFLNAIDIFIFKIKNQIALALKNSKNDEDLIKAGKEILQIQDEMGKKRQKTFEELEKILQIKNITTNRYATIITAAIILDIFLSELKKKSELEKKSLSFSDSVSKLKDGDEDTIKLMKLVIENFEKKYSKLSDAKLSEKEIEDLAKEIKNDDFDISKNQDEVKIFIDLIKERDFYGKTVKHKLRKKRSDQILDELLTFYNNTTKNIKNAFEEIRKKEYEAYIRINDMKQKANANIEKIFSDEEHIKKIIGAENVVSKFLIKKIKENKEEIKKEIIKEAITGLRKFTNVSDSEKVYESSKEIEAIANVVFHIDFASKSDNLLIDVNVIDTEAKLDKYVESIKNKIEMDFSFKGEQHKDGGGSFATLRIKVKNALDELLNKLNNKLKEEEKKENKTKNINVINIKNDNDVEEFFNSFNDINYEFNIYNEGFFSNLLDSTKKEINKIYDNFKLKILRILFISKNKASELFRLLGIKPKIKKARMPKWIVDKL